MEIRRITEDRLVKVTLRNITHCVVDDARPNWHLKRMPRPRGPHGANESTALAVRVPNDLLQRIHHAAGAAAGPELAEWHRNVLRRSVGVKLTYDVGYEEGKMAGWADAQARLRAALKDA